MKHKRQVTIYRGLGQTIMGRSETRGWYARIEYEDGGLWYEEATIGPFRSRAEAIEVGGPKRPVEIPPESAGAITLIL